MINGTTTAAARGLESAGSPVTATARGSGIAPSRSEAPRLALRCVALGWAHWCGQRSAAARQNVKNNRSARRFSCRLNYIDSQPKTIAASAKLANPMIKFNSIPFPVSPLPSASTFSARQCPTSRAQICGFRQTKRAPTSSCDIDAFASLWPSQLLGATNQIGPRQLRVIQKLRVCLSLLARLWRRGNADNTTQQANAATHIPN